jgi:hypothetical protein
MEARHFDLLIIWTYGLGLEQIDRTEYLGLSRNSVGRYASKWMDRNG